MTGLRLYVALLERRTMGPCSPHELAVYLRALEGIEPAVIEQYAHRLESMPNDVPCYPPLPSHEDLGLMLVYRFDPRWWPNPRARTKPDLKLVERPSAQPMQLFDSADESRTHHGGTT